MTLKLYFDLGLKTFCLFDFPLNNPFKCKGTTGSVSWAATPHTAFASGVFKLQLSPFSCSFLLDVHRGNRLSPARVAAMVPFPMFSKLPSEVSTQNCKCHFPCLMSDLWARSLPQRLAHCKASILHPRHSAGYTI